MEENEIESRDGVIEDIGMLDLRYAKTPEDLAHIKRIEDCGVIIIPETAASALAKIAIEDVGTIVYVPVGANVNAMTGQIRMSGEALAAGPEDGILVIIGQFFITSIPPKIGYKEIRVNGQLFAPRGSESVLGAKITEMNGQTLYVPEGSRIVMGQETLSREYLEYLDDGTAFAVMGQLDFEDSVDVELVRQKISEIVLMGQILAPRPLLPILQVLTKERFGEINARG